MGRVGQVDGGAGGTAVSASGGLLAVQGPTANRSGTGAQFLVRSSARRIPTPFRHLGDGSYLARIGYGVLPVPLTVRVIEASVSRPGVRPGRPGGLLRGQQTDRQLFREPRNSSSAAFTSLGRSSAIQWPQPGRMCAGPTVGWSLGRAGMNRSIPGNP